MSDLPKSARKVDAVATALGLTLQIREMPESTRTAEEAAAACDCAIDQIVKSLVFRTARTGEPVLLLVSGANRVDTEMVESLLGEPLEWPDADFVRQVTGFAIGGIPPFGHAQPLRTYLDEDLLGHDRIWAAAGTPKCLFSVDPAALRTATGADVIAMC